MNQMTSEAYRRDVEEQSEIIRERAARALADWILLEVAYQHWYRMNVERLRKLGRYVGPEDFLADMSDRLRSDARAQWRVWLRHGGAQQVLTYLQRRLTARRLSLPDGYDLGVL